MNNPRGAAPAPMSDAGTPETVEIAAGLFKNTCLSLMDEVATGARQYVITRHGRPVAKLVAPDAQAGSAFGFLRGTVIGQDDIVSPDPATWGEFA